MYIVYMRLDIVYVGQQSSFYMKYCAQQAQHPANNDMIFHSCQRIMSNTTILSLKCLDKCPASYHPNAL